MEAGGVDIASGVYTASSCLTSWVCNHGSVARDDFSYRTRKNGSVAISWRGREAKVLAGPAARRFLHRTLQATPAEAQLEMARVTGNFKRAKER